MKNWSQFFALLGMGPKVVDERVKNQIFILEISEEPIYNTLKPIQTIQINVASAS